METQTPIKPTFCRHHHPDWSMTDFHHHWREEHGPQLRQFKTELKTLRYVQVHNNHCNFGLALGKIRYAIR